MENYLQHMVCIADIPQEIEEMLAALQLPLVGPPMILTDSKNLCDNINARYSCHTKRYLDTVS